MTPPSELTDAINYFREQALIVVSAESCTGGLIAKLLTDAPGASSFFLGGMVCYNIDSKIRLLGVDPAIIDQYGVVSEAVAAAMAEGALAASGAGIAVSTTGYAGPDDEETGLVCMAVAKSGKRPISRSSLFTGSRDEIRQNAALAAIEFLFEAARGHN